MKNLRYIFALALIIMSGNILAETETIYYESFGSTSANTSYNEYTGYSATATMFTNTTATVASHYSGSGSVGKNNLSGSNLSSGYTGASGLSGIYHVGTANTESTILSISGINIQNCTDLSLSFGVLRGSGAHKIKVTYSIDGGAETQLMDEVINSSNTDWVLKTTSINATGNSLTLHFKHKPTSGWTIRLDDIKLTGEAASCTNKITITKGAESHGTFTISPVGETCADDPVTVSVTNISPANGYVASVITTSASGTPSAIANGAGTVTDISASTTIEVTFVPKTSATLTKSVLGTTSDMGFSGYFIGDQVSLPGCDVVKQGYVFYGWSIIPFSESEYTSQTIYKAGDKFTLTQATQTLYAVYAVQEGTAVISWSDFTSDNTMSECTFVIAGKVNNTYYAMKNNFGAQKYNAYEEVTLTDGHLLADEVADYAVTFEKTSYGATYKIKSNSLASNQYLHGKASDTELGKGAATESYSMWQVSTGTNGTYNIANYNLNSSSNLVANDNRRLICRTGEYRRFADYQSSNGTEYYDCEIIPVGSGYTYSKFATRFITYQNFAYKCTYDINYTLGDGHTWIDGYTAPATYDHNLHGTAIILPIADNLADGQYFRGWYDNAELTGDPITSLAVTGNGDKSVFADWANVVNFYVQGEIAEAQTIDADGHVTGYTPTATCTGKKFMGWSTINQTELIQDPASLNLFTDFSDKEFSASTDLYAVYASVNGGKVIGNANETDVFTNYSTVGSYQNTTPRVYGRWTIYNGGPTDIRDVTDKMGKKAVVLQHNANDASESMTAYVHDFVGISAYIATTDASVFYRITYSVNNGATWQVLQEPTRHELSRQKSLVEPEKLQHPIDALVRIEISSASSTGSSYRIYIDDVTIYTMPRSYWYSDYSTSCTMAESAAISYGENLFNCSAKIVGETVTISDDDSKKGYQLYSLTIHGVTYNVGDSYILAHDVTPEAADIRPVITWTERYSASEPWNTTTAPNENGKLVLPTTQPASFAPGLYEFYGWTAESFDNGKTTAPAIVSAETDAPAAPTTYYAVYRKQNNTGGGYTYRETTPSQLYQLTYSPNGGDGTDYITYTDLSTATTPASNLFTREGATLVGWTLDPNAETIEYVGTSAQITDITADRHYYAVWIGKLEMNKTIALTSAYGATVGSATFTLSSKNLGTITALRFSYKDVDNNITYSGTTGETARSKSEFRLCNESYTLAEDNLDVSTLSTNFSQTYTITYAPNSGNKMSHYKLVVELLNKSKVMTTQEFDLLGRALPDQFVIATQKNGQWYALQANMTSSQGWAGVPIDVEDGLAFASDTLLYSLRTYNNDKSHVLFQSAYQQGHLWAASGTETGIRNYATTTITGENNPYAWLLTSENDLLSYTIRNKQDKPDHQYLGMNGTNMGMYQLNIPMQFYFLPLGFKDTIEITSDSTLHAFEGQNLSHADIVVKSNGTLTIDQSVKVKDVTVETGGKLNITGETFTINSLHLEGGWDEEHTLYDVPNLYIAPEASLVKTIDRANLDMRVDKTNYYPFAVPFPVKVSDVDYVDATLAAASTYGKHFVIKTYDGALRAENGMDKENNWVAVSADATLQPGVGYILTAVTVEGYDSRLRFPMTFSNDWTAYGEQGEVAEMVKNQTHIYQFESGIHSCHSGWNMVAVPFMSAYGDGVNTTLSGVTYVTIPTYDFAEYRQVEVKDTVLRPEWSFFIQAEADGTLNFLTEQERLLTTPISAPQRVEDVPEYAVAMRLSGSTTCDKTTLKVSDRYTTAYEIGADLEKMFGNAYTLATYTVMDGTRLAFNALDTEHAGKQIPMGYRVPDVGEYTFSVQDSEDLSNFEHLYLTDNQTGITTDLLTAAYTFSSARTQDDERFVLNVQMRAPSTPTALDNAITNGESAPQKVIYQGKFYIIDKGVVYDGQGKRVMTK